MVSHKAWQDLVVAYNEVNFQACVLQALNIFQRSDTLTEDSPDVLFVFIAVNNVNKALEGGQVMSLVDLQKGAMASAAIRNNGGGMDTHPCPPFLITSRPLPSTSEQDQLPPHCSREQKPEWRHALQVTITTPCSGLLWPLRPSLVPLLLPSPRRLMSRSVRWTR